MSSYILSLLKSIGEFAVEAAAAALKMDTCYSQVNRFFSPLINSGQNIYGAMDLLLYHWGILLSVLSCQSLCYLKMLGDFYFGQGVVSMYGNIDFLLFTNMLKAPIETSISNCCQWHQY